MPSKTLHFPSPRHLSQLYADREENLEHAERVLGVKLVTREGWLKIEAPSEPLAVAEEFFGFLQVGARGPQSQAQPSRVTSFTPGPFRVLQVLLPGRRTGVRGLWQCF